MTVRVVDLYRQIEVSVRIVAERLHLTRITGPEGLTLDQLKSRLTDVLLDFGGISFRRGKKRDHGWKFIRLLSAEEIDYLLNEEWLS